MDQEIQFDQFVGLRLPFRPPPPLKPLVLISATDSSIPSV